VLGAGLLVGGAAGISAASGSPLWDLLAAAVRAGLATGPSGVPGKNPDFTIAVERETDLLLLDFEFFEFTIDTAHHPPQLKPSSASNLILIRFPPQAIGEAVYFFDVVDDDLPVDPAPILSVQSGPSQLVFTLDKSATIPLKTMTAADLLDWSGWTLAVAPGASFDATTPVTQPVQPTGHQTFVEAPYGLFLSPVVDERTGHHDDAFTTSFQVERAPLTADKVTSVWSATMKATATKKGGGAPGAQVSAVWASDYNGPGFANTPDGTPEEQIVYDS
jgi:hypothetical protein